MSTGWIITIIVIALAAILGNIMLLKKTAHVKMPSLKDLEPPQDPKDNPNSKNESTEQKDKP